MIMTINPFYFIFTLLGSGLDHGLDNRGFRSLISPDARIRMDCS